MKVYTYKVHFTVKSDYSEREVAEVINLLGEDEILLNGMRSYELSKVTEKASFEDLYDFCFRAYYLSSKKRKESLDAMTSRYTKEPHLSVMKMVDKFKVAFTETVTF